MNFQWVRPIEKKKGLGEAADSHGLFYDCPEYGEFLATDERRFL